MKKFVISTLIAVNTLILPLSSLEASQPVSGDKEGLILQIQELQRTLGSLLLNQDPLSSSDGVIQRMTDWQPTQTLNSSCVSLPGQLYINCYGGRGSGSVSENITIYDEEKNKIGYFPSEIPSMYATACAPDTNENFIYCFGGYQMTKAGKWQVTDDIFIYNTRTKEKEAFSILDTKLPFKTAGMSCVESSVDELIYCFGGYLGNKYDLPADNVISVKNRGGQYFSGSVISFNPDTKEVKIIAGQKAFAGDDKSCAYSGSASKVYCFGGDKGNLKGDTTDNIFSFDPRTKELEKLVVKMPKPLSVTSCVNQRLGVLIYCLGGTSTSKKGTDVSNKEIFTFDPEKEVVEVLGLQLPNALAGHSCVSGNNENIESIFCFDGSVYTKSGVFKFTPK